MAIDSRVGRHARALVASPRGEVRLIARRAFLRVARHFTPVVAVDHDGVWLVVLTDDTILTPHTFVHGGFEQDTLRRLIAHLPGGGREIAGRTVLEIGANVGTETVAFLTGHDAGRVIAVEPAEGNLRMLRLNIAANRLEERTQVLALALSDVDGTGRLALSDSNPGDHRVSADAGGGAGGAERETVEIRTARFDTLVERGEVDVEEIGLVWMDAQGHEGHVLAGAGTLLASGVPILTEYWPQALRDAGGYERFNALVADHYDTVLDLHTDDGRPVERIPAADLPGIAARRGWDRPHEDTASDFTDILLIGSPPPGPR